MGADGAKFMTEDGEILEGAFGAEDDGDGGDLLAETSMLKR